jgi:hypothetical protein
MLGSVAFTTVAVSQVDTDSGWFSRPFNSRVTGTAEIGEDIFGPFEASFTSQQDSVVSSLGCAGPADGYLDGGIDTYTAEQMLATSCNITLPRNEGNKYISLLDECGGHTNDYHNHGRLICLNNDTQGGHSIKVGEAVDDAKTSIYGKYEGTGVLPKLDACGAHFGVTPDSGGASVYHHHVQDRPPFTVGCFGPNDDGSLVTVEQCRDFYTGCGDGDSQEITTKDGTVEYDLWCPCYDANASNVGTATLGHEPELKPEPEPRKNCSARCLSVLVLLGGNCNGHHCFEVRLHVVRT